MSQVVTDVPASNQKDTSPQKCSVPDNGSPESPKKPLLDADLAHLLSKVSPEEKDDSCEEKEVVIHDLNGSNKSSTDLLNGEENPELNGSSRLTPEKNGSSIPKTDSINSDFNGSDTEDWEPCDGNYFEIDNNPNDYRVVQYSSSDGEDNSSECSDLSSDCSDSFLYELRKNVKAPNSGPKTKELKIPEPPAVEDLPAIEELKITVEESEVEKIGYIGGIVDLEAVVHALEGLKPLQLDSVLFLSNDQPLGHVSDVYGPVKKPFYSVRFNSREHMEKIGVKMGLDVFYAPEKSEITQYVFPEELQKEKGSDASGKNDNEPSDDNLDYSDDEKERQAKLRRKKKRREALMNLIDDDSPQEVPRTNYQQSSQQRQRHTNVPPNNPFYSMNNNNSSRPMFDGPKWQKPLLQNPNFNSAAKTHWSNSPQQTPPTNYRTQISVQPSQSSFQPQFLPQQNIYQPIQSHSSQHVFQPSQHVYQTTQAQPSQHVFQSTQSQPQQNMYQPPPQSPLLPSSLQGHNTYSFPPPSPLPFPQHSQFVQHSAVVGPPRPISFQAQAHMFGQMTPLGSPAPRLAYPNVMSPPPMVSTSFLPPSSPNFSYFSHPFPSAASPGPRQQSFYQSPPSPGVQVMPPMSPLSIQIPGNMRSPPPVATGIRVHRTLLQQQNVGQYRPSQRF